MTHSYVSACVPQHVPSAKLLEGMLWRFRSSLTNKQSLRAGCDDSAPADAADARLFQQLKNDIDMAAKRILASKIQQAQL